MKAHIFAEESGTTADDDRKPAKYYFEGLFGMVAGLTDELNESANTSLHILSQEFGLIEGNRPIVETNDDYKTANGDVWKDTQKQLIESSREADIMVILLSVSAFSNAAGEVWPGIVEQAKPGSIWCIGAARSTLSSIDFQALEKKDCEIIRYQRVGVASIGADTREELLEAVGQKKKSS